MYYCNGDLLDREGKMKMWLIGILLLVAFGCMFVHREEEQAEVEVQVNIHCTVIVPETASDEEEEDATKETALECSVVGQ